MNRNDCHLTGGSALQQRWLEFLGETVPFLTKVAGLRVLNDKRSDYRYSSIRLRGGTRGCVGGGGGWLRPTVTNKLP